MSLAPYDNTTNKISNINHMVLLQHIRSTLVFNQQVPEHLIHDNLKHIISQLITLLTSQYTIILHIDWIGCAFLRRCPPCA